ncbi:hypothetical protein PBI_DEWDROP_46 [Microbacterium phage Dewdrop]|nr:hypothetical protein PBI_LEAF_46 [Microbacterium phage Leaf]QGZ17415.1 hypothetical protein PBI_DEWDROP_46 [Microbacterium phage Dewdrop]
MMSMRELVFYDKAGNVVGRAEVPDEADSAQLLLPAPHDDILTLDELNSTPGLNEYAEFFREKPVLAVRKPGTRVSIKDLIHPPEEA